MLIAGDYLRRDEDATDTKCVNRIHPAVYASSKLACAGTPVARVPVTPGYRILGREGVRILTGTR